MHRLTNLFAATAVSTLVALPVAAQDADTVVATVGDTEITLGHMLLARASLPKQYQQLPDDVLFKGVLDQLVQQTALSQAVEGNDLPDRVQLALDNERRQLLAAEEVQNALEDAVSEEDLRAAYDAKYVDADLGKEFNASHIIVETEDEANSVIDELEGGADFAELAKEKSTGPSAEKGGDLGWFGNGQMVKPFEEAVADMEVGEISEPLKTQFGWHVIKLNDTRAKEAPAFEEVRGELRQQLQQQAVAAHVEETVSAADVDRSGAEGIDPSVLKDMSLLGN